MVQLSSCDLICKHVIGMIYFLWSHVIDINKIFLFGTMQMMILVLAREFFSRILDSLLM